MNIATIPVLCALNHRVVQCSFELQYIESSVCMVFVACDLNLTRHWAFIFLEEKFLAFLCALTDPRQGNVLFYSYFFFFVHIVSVPVHAGIRSATGSIRLYVFK